MNTGFATGTARPHDANGGAGVRRLEVAAEEAGLRLDRWFRRRFPDLPHGRLERLVRTGQVRVDGRRAKAGQRLAAGQVVRVPPLAPPAPPAPPPPDTEEAARLRALVLRRDDHVIALMKPPGLAVQGGSKVRTHVDALLDSLRFGAAERPRLVHRLDKDTSGVLILARTPAAAARLAAAFRGRAATKIYWALVVGVPRPRRGRIDLALAKRGAGGGERVVPLDAAAGGRRAVTDYAVIESAGRRVAWLALRPLTGRTHQIRAHLAALGTPVLGDGKYGGKAAFVQGRGVSRKLHLHARRIVLPHPAGGVLDVTAPLPDHMAASWRFFGFDPAAAPADPFAEEA